MLLEYTCLRTALFLILQMSVSFMSTIETSSLESQTQCDKFLLLVSRLMSTCVSPIVNRVILQIKYV